MYTRCFRQSVSRSVHMYPHKHPQICKVCLLVIRTIQKKERTQYLSHKSIKTLTTQSKPLRVPSAPFQRAETIPHSDGPHPSQGSHHHFVVVATFYLFKRRETALHFLPFSSIPTSHHETCKLERSGISDARHSILLKRSKELNRSFVNSSACEIKFTRAPVQAHTAATTRQVIPAACTHT